MKKTAIVTGAGAGVGRSVCEKLADKNYNLVLVGRTESNLKETFDLIKDKTDAIIVKADISKIEETQKYVNETINKYGRIDLFSHNAAVMQPFLKLADIENDTFDLVMDINVKGTFLGMKYVLKEMEKQGNGIIINTASTDALYSEPYLGAYVGSKHAMIGLTKNAAVEYGPSGIRTCAVCPGAIDTKMIRDVLDKIDPKTLGPLQRPAKPSEIADVIVYLASDNATYLNGAIIPVNGGLRL